MIININIEREILEKLESSKPDTGWIDIHSSTEPYEISWHIENLHKRGFIEAIELGSNDGHQWKAKDLTSSGRQYLKEIRLTKSKKLLNWSLKVSKRGIEETIIYILKNLLIFALGIIVGFFIK